MRNRPVTTASVHRSGSAKPGSRAPAARVARVGLVAAAGAALVTAVAHAADPVENRYPYDPACPWGRIANGKGMLVRCLSQEEAQALLARGGTEPEPAAGGEDAGTSAADAAPEAEEEPIRVELVEVKADVGKLELAMKKLGAPKDRYLKCLSDNGGLSGKSGQVHVRFLVRSRGRAEGVSVSKRAGVSAAAAACVAAVVDRRLVGTPEAPYVGATAIFKFTRP